MLNLILASIRPKDSPMTIKLSEWASIAEILGAAAVVVSFNGRKQPVRCLGFHASERPLLGKADIRIMYTRAKLLLRFSFA